MTCSRFYSCPLRHAVLVTKSIKNNLIDSVQEEFLIKKHESPGALMVSMVQTPQAQALTPHSQTHYRKPILNLHKHTHASICK